jgi:hypothetical protein
MGAADASVVLATPIPNPSESGDISAWVIFHEGIHKGHPYTAEDCRAIARNFATLLKLGVKVKVQLGHDNAAYFQLSLGLPCSGIVTRVWVEYQGGLCCVLADVDHIPGPVAKAIKEKQYPDHSADLMKNRVVRGAALPGWSLFKLSLLGDEPPGIEGLPSPIVRLRQTTQQDRHAWSQAASFSASRDKKDTTEFTRIAFSELFMTPRDQLLAQLKATHPQFDPNDAAGMSDEELQQLLSIPPVTGQSAQFSAACRKMFGMMPEAPPPAGGPADGGVGDAMPPPTDKAAFSKWRNDLIEGIASEAKARIGAAQSQGDLLALVESKAKEGCLTPRQLSLAKAIVADAGDERAMFSANAGTLANTSKHSALRELFGSMQRNPMLDELIPSGDMPATINGQDLNSTEAMILAKLGIKEAA